MFYYDSEQSTKPTGVIFLEVNYFNFDYRMKYNNLYFIFKD